MPDAPKTSHKQVRLRRPAVRLGLLLGVVAVVLMIASVTGVGERLFYYPDRGAFTTPTGVEDVAFRSEGRTLHGFFIQAHRTGAEPQPVIVFCHGNAGSVPRHLEFAEFLAASGCHVFLFDYRGYGRSGKGPLRRDGLIADTRAAIDAMVVRDDVDASAGVGIAGMSLGGTIGLAAAAEDDRVSAVCSVATFSRWPDIAGDHAGPIGRWLIKPGRDAVDSAARLGDRPLLLVHGTGDGIVPYRHGPIIRSAAEAAGVTATLETIDGAGHIDWVDHRSAREKMIAFFRDHLAAKAAGAAPP